ncbi:methyltransferase domain-containing protein [Kitasatospora sp. NPDC059571]|uniref:methyltransferase domain-containing protein n=1 Tax=Kitasatospora sp. NPDC059571 TaxID=3346871 RepID=UPI0036BE5898
MYSDADAAALYDLLNPWGPCDDFYLSFVMDSPSVLDVGCGTGMLLHRARAAGHRGRLCGLDPDAAALGRAARRPDVEWVHGRAQDLRREREFELAVVAGNAFQVFVADDELRAALAAVRAALRDGGRLVFGTRNPAARAWEGWRPERAAEVVDAAGRALRVVHRVESVADGVVTFTETVQTRGGEPLRIDRASLRFLDADGLRGFLRQAGFTVEACWGDWARGPLTDASENIVVLARAAAAGESL